MLTLMERNNLSGAAYVEPFAGGAGIAWALLLGGHASQVIINDFDQAIYAFWHSVLYDTENLLRSIRKTPVSMRTWKKQRAILLDPANHSLLDLGFAAFFLNRTNRSGVIRGGVIGGQKQSGKWLLDARYNQKDLIHRVESIARRGASIRLYNLNAIDFITSALAALQKKALVYLDPPYFRRGQELYFSNFDVGLHGILADKVLKSIRQPWVVSYDDVPAVRRLYAGNRRETFRLSYSVADRYVGSELLFFSPKLKVPVEEIPLYPKVLPARTSTTA